LNLTTVQHLKPHDYSLPKFPLQTIKHFISFNGLYSARHCENKTLSELEEASAHESAKTHDGNDLDPDFDLQINGFSGLIVERFYVNFASVFKISCEKNIQDTQTN